MSGADYSLPVLVVAPEPGQRQALSEMLIHQGQSVETAPDGGSAARLMERKAYKLVLAGSDLPEGDGLSLLKEIQRQAQITPTVLLSAQGDVRQAVEAIRHEMEKQGWNIAGVVPNKDMIHQILTKCCGGVGTFGEMVRLSEQDTKECD